MGFNFKFLLLYLIINEVFSVNEKCSKRCASFLNNCPSNCNTYLWECSSDNYCQHKELIPLVTEDVITGLLVLIISLLSTIGGISGGGLFIPLYIILGKFQIDYSIPLTLFTILGNALIRFVYYFNKKHNLSNNRYLIDYLIIILMVPFIFCFSFTGYILNYISSLLMITISLFIILLIVSIKTFNKGFNEYKLIDNNISQNNISQNNSSIEININSNVNPESKTIGDNNCDRYKYLLIIIPFFIIICGFSFTRNLITKCSLYYWLQIIGQFIILIICGLLSILYVKNKTIDRLKNNYINLPNDLVYNNINIIKIIIIASLIGIISTYLGIGGGMLITPFLNHLNMLPDVISSTSSVITFFSALGSILQYINTEKFLLYYSIYYFIFSSIGSLCGLFISQLILSKNKNYLIIFILSGLIFISCVLFVSINTIEISNDFNKNIEFNNFCD